MHGDAGIRDARHRPRVAGAGQAPLQRDVPGRGIRQDTRRPDDAGTFHRMSEMFKSVGAYVKEHRGELIPLIKEVFTGVAKFAVNLLPKIPVVLDKVLNIVNMLGPKTVVVGVAFMHVLPAITSIVVGLASIAPLVFKIIGGVKSLAGLFWPVVTAVKLTAAVLGGPVLATIGLVVAAVVSWGIAIKSVIDNWNLVPDAIEWIGTTIKESIGFWIDWLGLLLT